jgi:hypothetical protein
MRATAHLEQVRFCENSICYWPWDTAPTIQRRQEIPKLHILLRAAAAIAVNLRIQSSTG